MSERYKSVVCADLILKRMIDGKEHILLTKRQNTEYDSGMWELPGGHLEEGEDLYDAMIREIYEELLISLKRSDLRLVYLMHHYSKGRLNFLFEADGTNIEPKIGEPDKCAGMEWFSLDKLPEEMTDKMKKMILNANSNIFYDKL